MSIYWDLEQPMPAWFFKVCASSTRHESAGPGDRLRVLWCPHKWLVPYWWTCEHRGHGALPARTPQLCQDCVKTAQDQQYSRMGSGASCATTVSESHVFDTTGVPDRAEADSPDC
jgi:hypothetical protein